MPRPSSAVALAFLASLAVAAPLALAPTDALAKAAKQAAGAHAAGKPATGKHAAHRAAAGKLAAKKKGFQPVHAHVLMDARTGRILDSANADEITYPASLTKMMTLLLTFEAMDRGALSPGQELPVSARAANQKPSRLNLAPGSSIRVEDAILALTVKSANDVAVVLAEAQGGSEARFAELMTAKARALGMSRTTFRNASGLPNPEQRTTARDMAILARTVASLPARHYAHFGRTSFVWNGTTVAGHNRLIGKVDGYDGIKTGFINTSGFNLAGSAARNGHRLIAVVLGGTTAVARDREVAGLLEEGFRTVSPKQTLADAGTKSGR